VVEDYRPRLSVDLGALRRNVRTLRQLRPQAEVMPVVKADAYGLGAGKIVPALMEEGCDTFFVAYPEEAAELRQNATTAVFYVFGAAPGTGPYNEHCRPLFYTLEDLEAWRGGSCGIQVEIGMHRLGIDPHALAGVEERREVSLVIGHMSDAGDPASDRNHLQRSDFHQIAKALARTFPNARFSLSSTGGLMLEGDMAEDAVRPGVGLYGASPGSYDPLEPVATLEARVLSVQDIPSGARVGYNGTWTAPRPSRLATLGIGYADGLPRSVSNRGWVAIGGEGFPIVGAVSMDLTIVDISKAQRRIAVGDWAEIFGRRISIDRLAEDAGTIGYELLTSIGGRTRRTYRDEDDSRR
jgi:alanine racemase